MKTRFALLPFIFLTLSLSAQKETKNDKNTKKEVFAVDSTKVLTLNKTITTLYKTISAEKNKERNWKQFKFLFKPSAKLIPTGNDSEGINKTRYLTPQEYIKDSKNWLKLNGFIEKEIHRKVNTFGNIAHVFSTYEAYYSTEDEKPFMRGINSIQLQNDGKRWWIVNILWSQETKKNPIPKAYLPRK